MDACEARRCLFLEPILKAEGSSCGASLPGKFAIIESIFKKIEAIDSYLCHHATAWLMIKYGSSYLMRPAAITLVN